jgi:hypothetical protein
MKLGEKNVGLVDRVIRIVIGFFVLGFGAKYLDFPVNLIVALVGFIIVGTGVIGTCALYSLLGINTGSLATQKPMKEATAPTPATKTRRKAKNA